jgi:hypothetical protein
LNKAATRQTASIPQYFPYPFHTEGEYEESAMNSTETRKFQQAYNRFQRLLQLQGYSEATYASYGRCLRRFAHWYRCCPHAGNYIQWITFLYSRKAEEINLEAFLFIRSRF